MDERMGELLSLSERLEEALAAKEWGKAAEFLRSREDLLDGLMESGYLPANDDEEALRVAVAADQRGRETLSAQLAELEDKIGRLQDMKKLLLELQRIGSDQGGAFFDQRG